MDATLQRIAVSLLLPFLFAAPGLAGPTLKADQARRCFSEARALSERDAGRLWGIELYGPLMLVDPETRRIVANQADSEGRLKETDGVFAGVLPDGETVANTALDWSGVRWTMLRLPLPQDREQRAGLLAHEMWHRIQDRLGLPMANPANAHLDGREGRIWMFLEWRALARALGAEDADHRRAAEDALLFRQHRRALFPAASAEEAALELNEGLAEYTGIRLSSPSAADARRRAAEALRAAGRSGSISRSFAYVSGPAWGMLLDQHDPDWRSRLSAGADLGDALRAAIGIEDRTEGPDTAEVTARGADYGAEAIVAAETARAERRAAALAELRARFVTGPVLRLPLRNSRIQFDPQRVQPIAGVGTVYYAARLADEWGVLDAERGVLVGDDWTWAQLPAPSDRAEPSLEGDGWQLDPAEGWTVVAVPDGRRWTVKRTE